MRHDPADIGYRLGLHAEEDQADSIRPNDVERDLGEAEEAGRIAGRGESVDERRLDEIEVGLAVIGRWRCRLFPMRRLPLRRWPPFGCMIVTEAGSRVSVMSVTVMHIVSSKGWRAQ